MRPFAIGLIAAIIGFTPASAAKVCVEEVGGVCLKYEERTVRRASPEEVAERRLGLTRSERRVVQEGLRAEGFYNGAIDGAIGPQSRRAIARWQGSIGADGTGFLTASQFSSLQNAARPPAPTPVIAEPAPAPAPAPEPEPEKVVIAEPEPEKEEPHPQLGRVYSQSHVSIQGSRVQMDVERIDDVNVRVTLTVDAEQRLKKSCTAPFAQTITCYIRKQSWNMIYINGKLPRLSASESEVRIRTPFRIDKEVFKFW